MPNYTKLLLIAPLLLAACAQSDSANGATELAPTPSTSGITLDLNLAQPQPEKPICAVCNVNVPNGIIVNDDELSMIINTEYVGEVNDLEFIVYTDTAVTTYTFDSSVVDDLNDSATTETIVMMEVPDIVRGLLVFELDTATRYEPVFVNNL